MVVLRSHPASRWTSVEMLSDRRGLRYKCVPDDPSSGPGICPCRSDAATLKLVSRSLSTNTPVIALPIFAPPSYMNQGSDSSLRLVDVRPIQVAGLPLAELHAKYRYDHTAIQLNYEPVAVARAVAKIGYAFAVLRLGLERITDRYVLPSVLDGTIGIGQWVGCDNGEPVGASSGLHALTVQLLEMRFICMYGYSLSSTRRSIT